MTFEIDYPGLKGFHEDTEKLLFSVRQGHSKIFNERAIKNHCVDKQRLREAIDRIYMTNKKFAGVLTKAIQKAMDIDDEFMIEFNATGAVYIDKKRLLKELGL